MEVCFAFALNTVFLLEQTHSKACSLDLLVCGTDQNVPVPSYLRLTFYLFTLTWVLSINETLVTQTLTDKPCPKNISNTVNYHKTPLSEDILKYKSLFICVKSSDIVSSLIIWLWSVTLRHCFSRKIVSEGEHFQANALGSVGPGGQCATLRLWHTDLTVERSQSCC